MVSIRKVPLLTFRDIPVFLDYTWLLIVALLIWGLGIGNIQALFPWMHQTANWIFGLTAALLLFGSVLFHQSLQTLQTLSCKVTIRHIKLFIFGGAQIYELDSRSLTPKQEMKIASIGLISRFLTALFMLILLLLTTGENPVVTIIHHVSSYLFTINSILLLLHCIPGLPFDGGYVLRAKLQIRGLEPQKASDLVAFVGRFFVFFLICGGVVLLFLSSFVIGLIFIFTGNILKQNLEEHDQYILLKRSLSGIRVADIMTRDIVTVPEETNLHTFVNEIFPKHRFHSYPIVRQKKVVGIVRINDVYAIPRDEWEKTTMPQIETARSDKLVIRPDADIAHAFYQASHNNIGRLLVEDDAGNLLGYLSLRDITDLLALKNQDIIYNR